MKTFVLWNVTPCCWAHRQHAGSVLVSEFSTLNTEAAWTGKRPTRLHGDIFQKPAIFVAKAVTANQNSVFPFQIPAVYTPSVTRLPNRTHISTYFAPCTLYHFTLLHIVHDISIITQFDVTYRMTLLYWEVVRHKPQLHNRVPAEKLHSATDGLTELERLQKTVAWSKSLRRVYYFEYFHNNCSHSESRGPLYRPKSWWVENITCNIDLKEIGAMVYIGFIWLGIRSNGGLLWKPWRILELLTQFIAVIHNADVQTTSSTLKMGALCTSEITWCQNP
jgi:hypothetical protein